jgi:RHS repeat-associated protein
MLDNLNLVHMNGRVYDQHAGRFISPDPFIDGFDHTQGWNRYTYVKNAPLSFTDPTQASSATRRACGRISVLWVAFIEMIRTRIIAMERASTGPSATISRARFRLPAGHPLTPEQRLTRIDRMLFMREFNRSYGEDNGRDFPNLASGPPRVTAPVATETPTNAGTGGSTVGGREMRPLRGGWVFNGSPEEDRESNTSPTAIRLRACCSSIATFRALGR